MRAVIHLVVIALALACGRTAFAEDDAFKIIVHPENPVTDIERALLRDAFLKKATAWPGGRAFRPIGLTAKHPARERFVVDVLKKTTAQLKSYWTQLIFSGKGIPPPESDSVARVIAYVIANPGAVAFVPANADVGKAKVIEIR
jgi:ABC-type phosphate transport system substrate-binding protein